MGLLSRTNIRNIGPKKHPKQDERARKKKRRKIASESRRINRSK